jgi:hypothetical protein
VEGGRTGNGVSRVGTVSLDGPAESGGFTVEGRFLQRINGVPDEALKLLYRRLPRHNRRIMARLLLYQGPCSAKFVKQRNHVLIATGASFLSPFALQDSSP